MDHYSCGGYVFSSNFDSGNLHKVELVHRDDENGESSNFSGVEFNLWTKPDCAGTEYENLNRSWFFFSIHGGEPNKVCKLNVVNLNKQAKLFSQGMHPVIRIGDSGKWERTRDAPMYHVDDGDFVLTFFHKPQENVNTKYYYAFTFPFTYTENQSQLSRFDEVHQRSEADVDYISSRLNADTNQNTVASKGDDTTKEAICTITTSPSETFLTMSNTELENEIYYHRELLIHSIEKRRVDLLTITSFHNITGECEHRFSDLFPEKDTPRCRLFRNKKIIFVSSRVHPGETPASFVLNGFMKMLLDRKNKYSSILRRMYVFKIVPFLNPDGVFNGCYRSDTMGQNLNRVYLFPKIETQPSIYAVRKLIRYYHNDKELDESAQSAVSSEDVHIIFDKADVKNNNVTACSDSASSETDTEPSNKSEPDKGRVSAAPEALAESEQSDSSQNASTSSTLSHPSFPLENTCPEVSAPTTTDSAKTDQYQICKSESVVVTVSSDESTSRPVFCDKFVTEIKPVMSTLPAIATVKLKDTFKVIKRPEKSLPNLGVLQVNAGGNSARSDTKKETHHQQRIRVKSSTTGENIGDQIALSQKKCGVTNSSQTGLLGNVSYRSTMKMQRKNIHSVSNNNINISTDFLEKCNDSDRKAKAEADNSNMFLYIDLHGHASKKGIFMYGNHLPNTAEAVECMLLPRLMSINCHHFHFDACVFSERNMYHRGKRDGLSKEGSGRVAIYKATGLIKCYTLEGNYNTGKYVNKLPPRGKETNAKAKIHHFPPKYTPVIFEEVGRALGPSILDLTESNPISRLRNSEFRSLQGLRNSLRNEIDRNLPKIMNAKAIGAQSKARHLKSSSTYCSSLTPDIFKENKGRVLTNKQPSIYGKKEKASMSVGRKKGKVLCDVIPTSSSKFPDTSQASPIPSKRPKVVTTKKLVIDDAIDSKAKLELSCGITSDDVTLNKKVFSSNELLLDLPSASTSKGDAIKSASFIDSSTQPTATFDPNTPCCSHQKLTQSTATANTIAFSAKLRKPNAFLKKSPNHTPGTLIHGSKLKSSTGRKMRSSFTTSSGPSTSGHQPLRKSVRRSSLSKEGSKLKKKKSVIADSSLKRKKSKIF